MQTERGKYVCCSIGFGVDHWRIVMAASCLMAFYLHWQFPLFKNNKVSVQMSWLPCLILIFKSIYVLCIIESFFPHYFSFFERKVDVLWSYCVFQRTDDLNNWEYDSFYSQNSYWWSRNPVENPWECSLLMTWNYPWIIPWVNDVDDSENHYVCVMMSSMRFRFKLCLKASMIVKNICCILYWIVFYYKINFCYLKTSNVWLFIRNHAQQCIINRLRHTLCLINKLASQILFIP